MAKILKQAGLGLAAAVITASGALASQGPGVGPGTATLTEQIWLGVGFAAVLVAIIALDRRGRS